MTRAESTMELGQFGLACLVLVRATVLLSPPEFSSVRPSSDVMPARGA